VGSDRTIGSVKSVKPLETEVQSLTLEAKENKNKKFEGYFRLEIYCVMGLRDFDFSKESSAFTSLDFSTQLHEVKEVTRYRSWLKHLHYKNNCHGFNSR
jgi:hypothetical protein